MRLPVLAASLFLAALAAPSAAHAQIRMSTRSMAPAVADSASRAGMQAVKDEMDRVAQAQHAYFAEHGTYAESLEKLPGHTWKRELAVMLTAGRDWFVLLGGGPRLGVEQLVVWREGGTSTPRPARELD
jgi:hypothetical protein